MNKNTLIWIWLSMIFPPASIRLYDIYNNYQNSEEIYKAIKEQKITNLTPDEQNVIKTIGLDKAEDILNFCRQNSISIITLESEDYPVKLMNTDCPPAVIYCLGNIQTLNAQMSAAIVGARNACSYSMECADFFAQRLAENDVLIVSGFANGIDSAAHYGAIRAGGNTAAVLGSGILYDYPKNKFQLKYEIAAHGAVISEYPPLEPAQPEYFKIRNRIISGLSDGVLVVEAGKKSGAINTVSHALEQGREVYVIPPHDIFDRSFDGQSLLIKDGAREVYSPAEILNDLNGSVL